MALLVKAEYILVIVIFLIAAAFQGTPQNKSRVLGGNIFKVFKVCTIHVVLYCYNY